MMMMSSPVALGFLATSLLVAAPLAARAESVEEFYRGRTVKLVISNDPGGTYDLYARLGVRHMGKFIPGHPLLLSQNMPAAGGLVAANYMASVAPRDGSVLGSINANTPFAQVLGAPGIQYDVRAFAWVGRFTGTTSVFFTWHSSPSRTLQDLVTRETLTAGTGPTSNASIVARMTNELLGTKFKQINGYNGTSEANLALQRGEVEGVHWNLEGTYSTVMGQWLAEGKVRIVTHYGTEALADFPQVPSIYEITQNEEQRQVLRLFGTTDAVGRSLLLPPEVPPERVAALRAAFADMVKDRDFLADAAQQKLVIRPMLGEALQDLINVPFQISPANVEIARRYYR